MQPQYTPHPRRRILPLREELLAHIAVTKDGCWEWTGIKNNHGYGRLTYTPNRYLTHRLYWQLFIGEIPQGLVVCHHCDNPPCMNPDHLFLGTLSDNQQDASRKGRNHSGRWDGEDHPMAKITNATAHEIKDALAAGERVYRIAKRFGVHPSTVGNIKSGLQWRLA